MRDLAKHIIKKYREGGEAEDWQREIDEQVEGMSPEAKDYLLEKLKGEDVGGRADDEPIEEDREDLLKELGGMGDVGKKYLEQDIEKEDPWAGIRKEMAHGGEASVYREASRVGHNIRKDDPMWDRKGIAKKTGREIERDQGPKMAKGGAVHHPIDVTPPDLWKGKRKKDEEDKECPSEDKGYAHGGEAKNWIQGAVKKPGALRATASREGLIKGGEKLSSTDLHRLAAQAKKSGNKLLAKRVSLAKTFSKMRK